MKDLVKPFPPDARQVTLAGWLTFPDGTTHLVSVAWDADEDPPRPPLWLIDGEDAGMRHVAIFSRVLSQAEVQRLAAAGHADPDVVGDPSAPPRHPPTH